MTGPSVRAEDESPIVYVIDDDLSVRAALEDLLASVGMNVQSFGSTREFLEAPIIDAPGCLVLDIRMPGQGGLEFQRQMEELGVRLPVIFITGHGDIAMSVKAMKDGATDFLTKPFHDQALLDAINTGIAIDRDRRRSDRQIAELGSRSASLTAGERDVLGLVAQGLLNKQIAAELDLSEITVKKRRGRVMRKMKARSLVELVRMSDQLAASSQEP